MPVVETIPLHETHRERYLNYALSVITSRALPDVRDGLKPVQRRILYAMFANLRLVPDARHRKSASVVGEVMGKYHPHGDLAIYDAMVRMAQDFSLRAPLVDGQGNFGSLDGDNPAAMRYTEARLTSLGAELLREIRQQTVPFRPTYDGQLSEPVVLPAPVPNLLVNGASGIAVGMATNIPPHNLGEVLDACIHLVDSPNARLSTLTGYVKAPDFPTGGRILNTEEELEEMYKTGEGPIDLRGTYEMEGKSRVIVTSIPYGVSKGDLVERIGDHIREGKVPQLVDVRDESTDEVRIVLEVKRGANAEAALAYLFKHTALRTRFHVNLTCLVPPASAGAGSDKPEIARPEKLGLHSVLRHFLDFRLEVTTKRLEHELAALEKRIHILKGFAKIFDALDEAIKLIRASKDRTDANQRLRHRFGIDEEQADAILEIRLYRLAQMEIDAVLNELEEKEARAADIRALLADEDALWNLVKGELQEMKKAFDTPRRTEISGPDAVIEYSAEDYIVEEDVVAIVTRDGWVKRQGSYTTLDAIRVREGDAVAYALESSTRAPIVFFTSAGKAYTCLVDDLPQTTGHGDPIQKMFDFSDREKVVGVASLDARTLPKPVPKPDADPELFDKNGKPTGDASTSPALSTAEGRSADALEGPFVVAVTAGGYATRMELSGFEEPTNKNGRTFMRLRSGDRVAAASVADGTENCCLATKQGRGLVFPVEQISVYSGPAKGVIAMRLQNEKDAVLGMAVTDAARDGLEVETSRGRTEIVRTTKFDVTNRGGKGKTIIKRGTLSRAAPAAVELRLS